MDDFMKQNPQPEGDADALTQKPEEALGVSAEAALEEIAGNPQTEKIADFFAEENFYTRPREPEAAVNMPPQNIPPRNMPPQAGYPYPPPHPYGAQRPPVQNQNPYIQAPYPPQGMNPPYPNMPQNIPPQGAQYGYRPPVQPNMQPPPPYIPPQAFMGDANSIGMIPPKKKSVTGAVIAVVAVGVLLILLVVMLVVTAGKRFYSLGNSFTDSSSIHEYVSVDIPTYDKPTLDGEDVDAEGRYSTQGVAKIMSPSVVGVIAYTQGQTIVPTSEGSGIILTADGYIATNAHVITDATAQKVILYDGTEYIADVIGRDVKSDLAVLKIVPTGEIVPATLGNSDELELGEQVITLGNPGGLANSFSGGYVSGLDRQIKSSENGIAMNCIQTDAAVNPGNSGGPLVNMYGQVVGIVSSKYIDTSYEGIGFAIAVNDALPIVNDIISQGYVSDRIRIGINFYDMDDKTAREIGVVPGLYIDSIDPTCDVAKSGLQVNDIITEMNGVEVYDYQSVMAALDGFKPGDTVTAKVYRKTIIGEVSEFEISFKLMQNTTGE